MILISVSDVYNFLLNAPSGVMKTSLIVIFMHSLERYRYDITECNIPVGSKKGSAKHSGVFGIVGTIHAKWT